MIRKMGGIQRCNNIPGLVSEGKLYVADGEKAEVLAKSFVKVHSNGNISNEMKNCREQNLRKYPKLLDRKDNVEGTINIQFSIKELKQALMSVIHTSAGKDEICYEIIKHLSDTSLNIILSLFNKIWKEGKLPTVWKHAIIIPIAKPGKDQSNPLNYRPM